MEDLVRYALDQTRLSLEKGDATAAIEWLESVPVAQRPRELTGTVNYEGAKAAAATAAWPLCLERLTKAVQSDPQPLYQERLALARRRAGLIDDQKWTVLAATVDPAQRLPDTALAPTVDRVWACGAYYSWGALSQRPWSRIIRLSKEASGTANEYDEEAETALSLSVGYFVRFLMRTTSILAIADAVVAIPPKPDHYARRMRSLPVDLAEAVRDHAGIPLNGDALHWIGKNIELRGLTHTQRRAAIRGTMKAGDIDVRRCRKVLLVDDVVTSGATLCEAARLLKAAGVEVVLGLTLGHTEG